MAQDVLEQDLDRDRGPPEIGGVLERRQAEEVGQAGTEAGPGAERVAGRHGDPRWLAAADRPLGAAGPPPGALRCRPKSSVESDDRDPGAESRRRRPRATRRRWRSCGAGWRPARGRCRRARGRCRPARGRCRRAPTATATRSTGGPPPSPRRPHRRRAAGDRDRRRRRRRDRAGRRPRRAGWPVGAVASRDPARRERFRALVPGARAFAEAPPSSTSATSRSSPSPTTRSPAWPRALHLYSGQALVHTSGLLGAEVLAPALAAGTSAGSFHPLVAFADVERALAALPGATVAVEGDDALIDLLAEMAESIGAAAGPPRAGLEGRLPRRRRAGRGRPRRAPRRRRRGRAPRPGSTRRGRWRSTARSPRRRSPMPGRWGSGRPSPGPRSAGDAGTIEAHLAALAPAGAEASAVYRAPGPPPGHDRRGAARPRTGSCGSHPRGVHKRRLRGYDLPMHRSIAARYAARPAARFATVAPRAREPRLGLDRHVRFTTAADRPTLLRRPELGPVALLRADWRAVTPARAHPASAGLAGPHAPVRWAKPDVRVRRPPAASRLGAVARLKRATATSAGGIVVRSIDGDPAPRRRPPARANGDELDLDAPQGHPEPRRDARGDRPPRGRRGDRAGGPHRGAPRRDRVLVRPGRHADPQDGPLLPDGADRRRPRAPRPRVRRGPLGRPSARRPAFSPSRPSARSSSGPPTAGRPQRPAESARPEQRRPTSHGRLEPRATPLGRATRRSAPGWSTSAAG